MPNKKNNRQTKRATRRTTKNANKKSRKNLNKHSHSLAKRGGASLLQGLTPAPLTAALPGGLSSSLPTTDWGRWAPHSETYAWSADKAAPAPLANGGLYTNPQSTQPWGSSPFPATQHAFAVEAAKVSGLPEVAYHQRPNDNFGSSYSPVVGTPITPNHTTMSGPAGPIKGGARRGSSRRGSSRRGSSRRGSSRRGSSRRLNNKRKSHRR